ncbi:lipopolysaccharide biosynthesis protein [Sphingopyxis kveilinensis]|uniref:lipopolysaccharide biosynthesis protein n=1 Tax=Sphingopyxis kveilinensis TaxID=3114367 RepID=UPI0030CFECCC
MRWSYFVAIVANRGLAFALLLTLSHIMRPADFGLYSLVAVNALVVSNLAGTWIATTATRLIAICSPDERGGAIARIARITAYVLILQLAVGTVLAVGAIALGREADVPLLVLTLAWAMATIIYDVVLATKNGLSAGKSYMSMSIARNLLALLFCVALAFAGLPASWVVTGQVAAILIAVAASSSVWQLAGMAANSRADPSVGTRGSSGNFSLLELLAFGFSGTMVFSFLVIMNGVFRNAVFYSLGTGATGVYALVGDMFYAPITLLAAAYSLSRQPHLYSLADAAKDVREAEYSRFLGVIAFTVIGYGAIGFLLAPSLIAPIVSDGMRTDAVIVASWSALQTALVTMMVAYTQLLLASGQKRKVWLTVLISLCFILVAAFSGMVMKSLYWFAVFGVAASFAALVLSAFVSGSSVLPLESIGRSAVAAAAAGCAVFFVPHGDGLIMALAAALIGGLVYLLVAWLLRASEVSELLPVFNRRKGY